MDKYCKINLINMTEDLTYYDNTIISNAIYYSKGIQNKYTSIIELRMHLEDALTSFILRFYNFARRLIAKLQKKFIFTPVFGPNNLIGEVNFGTIFELL